jgi:hypothetical protein
MSVLLGVFMKHVLKYSLRYLFEGRSQSVLPQPEAYTYIHTIFLASFFSYKVESSTLSSVSLLKRYSPHIPSLLTEKTFSKEEKTSLNILCHECSLFLKYLSRMGYWHACYKSNFHSLVHALGINQFYK